MNEGDSVDDFKHELDGREVSLIKYVRCFNRLVLP